MEKPGGVLIAGAGPVGFITALGLARAGIPVTVIEAEEKINDSPRAAVYFPVTLEFLERLGIVDEAHAIGVQNDKLQIRYRDADEAYVLSPSVLRGDTRYPYQLHFGQNELAELVHRRLAGIPETEVRFNTRLVAIAQDSGGVTATARTPRGDAELRCDWLIGCDGGRSGVRKALNLSFDGHTWPERFVATNVRYDHFDRYGLGLANFFSHPVRWAVVAVVSRTGLWRVTYNEDGDCSDEEAIRRVPQRYAELFPDLGRYELVAVSPYRVHERISEKLRVGRVLLAGDAAHVCNPCGGMGLTTGLMDAQALIDALGAVIHGKAHESVLDFYADERRRVFLEVTTPAATEYRRLLGEKDPERRRRDRENLRHVTSHPEIMRQNMLSLFGTRGRPMLQ
ncbi:MAG: FAD-dependent monooxygenase [Gammaproteobacteria bacterium]|nr:FAD-dependent monooxygenase [Gammaproteobacteria bacterium]